MPTSPNDIYDGLTAEALQTICSGPARQRFTRDQNVAAYKVQKFSRYWLRTYGKNYGPDERQKCFDDCHTACLAHFGAAQLEPLNCPAPHEDIPPDAYGFGIVIATLIGWVLWHVFDAIWTRIHKQ